jgi:superfamily II DNA or RNA helicase
MSYPSISDDNFSKKINNIYKKFTIFKSRKNFNKICFPENYKLQLPQKFVAEYINPNTPYKGILVYHRIGAGKTCTAVQIGEKWKHDKKIIVVVPASLKGNFRNELRSQCAGSEYLTNSERKLLSKYKPYEQEYKDIIEISDKRIDKYYSIYSYNKFIELIENGELTLHNSILIIDEIQNMVSEDGKYYNVLYNLIHKSSKNLRVVILSATPMFDKPSEIALTVNLLKLPSELPIGKEFDKTFIKLTKSKNGDINYYLKNQDLFKQSIKGFISYFRGAPPYVFPEMIIKYVKCEMSEFQYDAYKSVLRHEQIMASNVTLKNKLEKSVSVKNLPNNFYIGTRYVSNVVFPNKKIGEDGFKCFKGDNITKNLEKYSTKFAKIMKKVQHAKGKIFIYSSFKEYGGIKSLARVLDEFGYQNYVDAGAGRKRYAIWSGDENMDVREEIKDVYNLDENIDGGKIKILLATQAAKEGISLSSVKQIHILENYWNQSRIDQIIGRGNRYCSHKFLEPNERKLKVYIYMAIHPDELETVDQYITKLSAKKNDLIQQFEKLIKEAAVDCELFKEGNVFAGEDNIDCMV